MLYVRFVKQSTALKYWHIPMEPILNDLTIDFRWIKLCFMLYTELNKKQKSSANCTEHLQIFRIFKTIKLNQGCIINTVDKFNLSFENFEEMTVFDIFCLLLSEKRFHPVYTIVTKSFQSSIEMYETI